MGECASLAIVGNGRPCYAVGVPMSQVQTYDWRVKV